MLNILLDCLRTENWRITFLNGKSLSRNTDVVYRKVLSCTNKDRVRYLSRYFDKIKYTGFNRIKVM
jgi:hypothetical protein